jgi:hypothetical protein
MKRKESPSLQRGEYVKDIQDALTPEAFAAVPSELLANLEDAAKLALMTEIDRYIDEIRSYNATLGHTLATLAFDFDYVQIVSLIQEAKQ